MIICSSCGQEMHVLKTGRDVTFQPNNLTYSGDEYECTFCERRVVVCPVGAVPRDTSTEKPQDGRIIVGDLTLKEKVLEEGELGEVIGVFILKQGRPSKKEIKKAIEKTYGDTRGFDMTCEEYKPGVWKVASYSTRND